MRFGLLVLLVLHVGPPAGAAATLCLAGCDDRDPCTEDRCDGLFCTHVPASGAPCSDHDGCTVDDRCEAGRCVGTPVVCPDDGFACTDDVCLAGECTHVPVDAACVPADACTAAVCAPDRAGHDVAGCVPGVARNEGEDCAEDGDACTTDVCAAGRCDHVAAPDRATCTAVQGVFRYALALAAEARARDAALGHDAALATRVVAAFDAVVRALAGRDADAVTSTPLADTPLQRRVRRALAVLRDVRRDVLAGGARIARKARVLRGQLRRLLRRRATFAR
jgi:hypothetical protein